MSTTTTADEIAALGNRLEDEIGSLTKSDAAADASTAEALAAKRKKTLRKRAIKFFVVFGIIFFAIYTSPLVKYSNIDECISAKSVEFLKKGISPPYEKAMKYCRARIDAK